MPEYTGTEVLYHNLSQLFRVILCQEARERKVVQAFIMLFPIDSKKAIELWVKLNQDFDDNQCLEYDDGKRLKNCPYVLLLEGILIYLFNL